MNRYEGKKAIVTGATGFIGKFLVRELLSQGVEVLAVVRPNSRNARNLPSGVRAVECSLSEIRTLPSLVADRDIDAVCRVAWQGVSDADARKRTVYTSDVNVEDN